MKNFVLPLLAFTLILSACTEKIDVKLPNADDKLVIEGSIENGKNAEVIITRSIPLFSSIANTSATDFYVLDAQVTLFDGFTTETMHLAIDSASSLGIVYKSNIIVGIPGRNYSLTVIQGGKTFTAVTTIPEPIALDSVWWMPQPPKDSLGFANAHFSEPAGPGNNYRWYAKRPSDRRYLAPYGATFDDKYVDGKSFDFAYTKGYDPTDAENTYENDSLARGYYAGTDTIYIKFCTIDKASKDFYMTFENALSNNGNPFASPVTVLSNINGGALGVWAGFGATYDTIMPVQ
ncbi:MAG: hypothetical protein K0Q95_1254 [Bacteroidota bacterium]|jgi:hypothetical protein|nr:hypothetical protein [Bacteroidota bacterium]